MTTQRSPANTKRPRTDNSINIDDIEEVEKDLKRPRTGNTDENEYVKTNDDTHPSTTVLYDIVMRNNALINDLKDMLRFQFEENNLIKSELNEIKELMELFKSKNSPNDSKSSKQILSSVKDVKKSIQESITKVSEQISNSPAMPIKAPYSSVVKRNKPVIVVKPKDSTQSFDNTKAAVVDVIDPLEFKIQRVRKANKGGIVIECNNSKGIEELRKDAEAKLGHGYEITAPLGRCPKVKIIGMSNEMDDDDFLKTLMDQNSDIFSKDQKPKILHKFKTKNSNGVKIEVAGATFEKLMSARRVFIGWDSCIIYEAFDLSRCYNCCGFHHVAKNCKSEKVCGKCTLNHGPRECSSSILKCINCITTAKALKLELNIDHSAFSMNCEVFKHKIEMERQRINYNSKAPNDIEK